MVVECENGGDICTKDRIKTEPQTNYLALSHFFFSCHEGEGRVFFLRRGLLQIANMTEEGIPKKKRTTFQSEKKEEKNGQKKTEKKKKQNNKQWT